MRLIPYVRRTETPARAWPEVTRIFEDFFDDFPFSVPRVTRENWVPSVDVLEKGGELVLRAELPGLDEKDIELKLEGNVLTLKGERKFEDEETRNDYRRIESFHGSFSRSFTLPDSVDPDKVKAEYKRGILTVRIPMKPEVQPREIPVSVG